MSLLHTESFDTTTTVSTLMLRYGGAYAPGATLVTGRVGQGLSMDYTAYLTTSALAASGTTAIVGLAYKATGLLQSVVAVLEGSLIHVRLSTDIVGRLVISRGNGELGGGDNVVLGTSSARLVPGTWYYLELKCTIHDTAGTYEVRVDETVVLTATGADTRYGGTGVWDTVMLGNGNRSDGANPYWIGAGTFIADDWYVCDVSGSRNNTYLGNTKVTALLPQTDALGGAGTSQDFTPSTGTDHGALVDETAPNDDADYVSSSTVGHRDTFNYPVLTGVTGLVYGVVVVPYLRKTDNNPRTVATVVRASGTTYDHAATISPTTSYRYWTEIWETNPATSSDWTPAEINAAEFGIKVSS